MEAKTQEIIREDTLSVTHRLMGTVAENELEFVTAILCYFRSLKKKTIWWVKCHATKKLIFEGKKPNPICF